MGIKLTREEFEKRFGEGSLSTFQTLPENRPNIFSRAISDIPSDIQETVSAVSDSFSKGLDTAEEAREQVTEGEISPVAGTVKTIGGGLGAGASAIGEGLIGLLKLPFTQRAEEATGEAVTKGVERIAETPVVQEAVSKYEALDPEQKAIVDGVLGTTEGLATALGAGPAVKAGRAVVTSPVNVIQRGLSRIDDAAQELQGIQVPGVQGVQEAVTRGFQPEEIMQRVARISKSKQAKFEERAGESVGSYLVTRNIFGTPDQIVEQLFKRMKDSKGRVDESLATVQGEFKAPQVRVALDELIERDVKISAPGAKSPDSDRITTLFKKYNQQGLTLSEVNEVKRLYERNVKLDFLRDNVSDKIQKANNIDSALRNLVEDKASKAGVTTVRELNKETSLAKQLLDDLGAEFAGSAGNNAIGLTDALFLAEALGSANPVAAAGFVAKRGLGAKAVQSKIAQTLSRSAGSKEALPEIPDDQKLKGFLKFLESQANQTSP